MKHPAAIYTEAAAMIAEGKGFNGTAAALYDIARMKWRELAEANTPPIREAATYGAWLLAWDAWRDARAIYDRHAEDCAAGAGRCGCRVELAEVAS